MRRAAAYNDFDDADFGDHASGAKKKRSRLAWLLGPKLVKRVGATALVLLTGAVLVNVLVMQDQRHAAPLFQKSLRTAEVEAPAETPMPAPRPAELKSTQTVKPSLAARPETPASGAKVETARLDPIAREIARTDAPRAEKPKAVESRTSEPKAREAKAAEPKHDAIGGLIRSAGAETTASIEPSPSVMAAQRALMKLGFVIKPDGVFGATTRQAIERFERDNKLPVRGNLTPQVKRELARLSGVQAQ